MDIAVEMVDIAQPVEGLIDQIHRVIGTDHDAGTQEKSLNIVAPVKFYRQLTDFIRGKGSTFYIGVTVVLAVGAVKNTFIGKEDLEQRNTAPVRRE